MYSSILTRTVASLFILLTIVSGTASFPVTTHAISVTVIADLPRDPKELWLDALAWMVAKILVGTIIQELRGFINTGHFGDPLAIINSREFFSRLAQGTTLAFMKEISDTDIYPPIKQLILRNLAQGYLPATNQMVSTIQKTLISPDNFTNDFYQGGWVGYMTLLEPRNNIYGQMYMAKKIEGKKIAANTSEVQTDLSQSGGLLSLPGKCLEYAGTYDIDTQTQNTTYIDSFDYSGTAAPGTGATCIRWERLTPGQFIAHTLSNALGSPVDSLNNADEISELLAAAVQTLVNEIIMKGLNIIQDTVNDTINGTGNDTTSGVLEGGSSGISSSETISSDTATLIKALNNEIVTVTDTLSLRDSIVAANNTATTTIGTINTLLANSVFMAPGTRDSLLAYHKQLVNAQTSLTTSIAAIDATGITNTYLSALNTLKTKVANTTTLSAIFSLYQEYSNLTEPIKTIDATQLLAQKDDLLVLVNTITTITTAVNQIKEQQATAG